MLCILYFVPGTLFSELPRLGALFSDMIADTEASLTGKEQSTKLKAQSTKHKATTSPQNGPVFQAFLAIWSVAETKKL